MDYRCASRVLETQVLQPAVSIDPRHSYREDEARGDEREEDVGLDVGPFCYCTSRYVGHHHAKSQLEQEKRVVVVGQIQSKELVLAHYSTLCFCCEAVASYEERES